MKKKAERLQRWQQKTIDQFTKTVETLLLISAAFLGYLVTFKTDKNLFPIWLVNGLIAITTCIVVILVFLSYNRLRDFRQTTRRIRTGDVSLKRIREIGNTSWHLMHWALLLFCIDVIAFVLLIMIN